MAKDVTTVTITKKLHRHLIVHCIGINTKIEKYVTELIRKDLEAKEYQPDKEIRDIKVNY
jgi:hypothetical protein